MIAAMMLPASLPAFRSFSEFTSGQRHRRSLGGSFLAGYVAVWTGFGIMAFLGDFVLHHLVDHWPWLAARPWLIGGSVLVLAGAFELSPLARGCRAETGDLKMRPGSGYLLARTDASRMGAKHGLLRLRRCWALMLLSFAAGMASLAWMAALTLLMVRQSGGTGGSRTALVTGIGLLAVAGLVIAHPGWLPSLFPGGAGS